MYDRTYIIIKKLIVELHRLKYQHVDEPELYNKTNEILNSLAEMEQLLKAKIEGEQT